MGYFSNATLSKEYHSEESSPYTQECEVTLIKASEIDWKDGKDVTIEKVAKKVKGGGAKKAKQKKEKEEPRDSIFRHFFRTLKPDMPVPDDVNLDDVGGMCDDDDDDDDDEDDESDDEDEDDDEEEDSEDEPPARGRKAAPKKKGGKDAAKAGGDPDKPQEECKQQ